MRNMHLSNESSLWRLRIAVAMFGGAFSNAFAVDVALPPDVYGTYAPSSDCAMQPRIIVSKTGVYLDTAVGARGSLPIMVSYTFIGGARYSGIHVWALVKHGGKNRWGDDNTPVILTFNAGEKPGVLSAERENSGNERPVVLDGPLSSVVQQSVFRRCK
jgi:hypothetical protein